MTLMRVQRALARAGVASRRAAETLIENGVVRVDGEVATLGSKVDPDKQVITVKGKPVQPGALSLARVPQAARRGDHRAGRGGPPDGVRLRPQGRGLTYVGGSTS